MNAQAFCARLIKVSMALFTIDRFPVENNGQWNYLAPFGGEGVTRTPRPPHYADPILISTSDDADVLQGLDLLNHKSAHTTTNKMKCPHVT